MIVGISSVTLPDTGLATDIKIAGETGFDFVELRDEKLVIALKGGSLTFLSKLLKKSGVTAHAISLLDDIPFQDREGEAALESQCYAMASSAAKLGAKWIAASVGKPPAKAPSKAESRAKLKDLLSLYHSIAPLFGQVNLAFEFTGYPDSPVSTLTEARKLIDEVAPGKIGIVLDTFHFHLGGGSIEEIKEMSPDKIAFVQVADAPPNAADESDKLLPGEGVVDLRSIVEALESIGFDGAYSVEVNGSKYRGLHAEEIASRALSSVKKLLEG